jgi:hypothetical protein
MAEYAAMTAGLHLGVAGRVTISTFPVQRTVSNNSRRRFETVRTICEQALATKVPALIFT